MFDSLYLQNFQSHRNSFLELSPGVNVIIGETDSGKSAIIRSLYWLAFGKPSGTSIMRHKMSAKTTKVEVGFDEIKVKRIRGNSENYYSVDGAEYKGFGQNVPAPVTQALNLTDINFLRQLDSPFLLSKSSGEVAQYLNQLIDLSIIDTSLSKIGSMIRTTEHTSKHHEENIANLTDQLSQLDWIDSANEDIMAIEGHNRLLLKKRKHWGELREVLNNYERTSSFLKKMVKVRNVAKLLKEFEAKLTALNDMKQAREKLKRVLAVVAQNANVLQGAKAVKNLEKQISQCEKLNTELSVKLSKRQPLQKALQNIQQSAATLQQITLQHSKILLTYKQQMPKICPLCEQPIKEGV